MAKLESNSNKGMETTPLSIASIDISDWILSKTYLSTKTNNREHQLVQSSKRKGSMDIHYGPRETKANMINWKTDKKQRSKSRLKYSMESKVLYMHRKDNVDC